MGRAVQWMTVEGGSTIGKVGKSGGVIIRDEQLGEDARVTLEMTNNYFHVTANSFFGPIDHYPHSSEIVEALKLFDQIQANISETFSNISTPFAWPVISIEYAPHYTWSHVCDGWKLVDQPSMSVIQERMPAGTQEIRHKHSRVRQFFYVLRGELALEVDGVMHTLPPAHGLEIAPGQVHQARNDSGGDVEFLVISDGVSREDRAEMPIRKLEEGELE